MDKAFSLNDRVYNVKVKKDSLERDFAVANSEQSRRIMGYTVDRDTMGTFYNYTMGTYPKMDNLAPYDTFHNIISDPNYANRGMTFPYGQETSTFQAYASQGKDKLRIRNGKNIWGMDGLSSNLTAMEPQRR